MENTVQVGGGGSTVLLLVWLAIVVFLLAAMWKVFTKAGQPGWGSLIPFYNIYLLMIIAGKPGWWLVLMFVPVVNLVIAIIASIGVAQNFGKGGGFAAGLILLPIVFYPILAFGRAQYQGGNAPAAA